MPFTIAETTVSDMRHVKIIMGYFLIINGIVQAAIENASLDARVLKGIDCLMPEAAYLAVIKRGQNVFCGASIISAHFGLTAAHCCVEMKSFKQFQIHMGFNNIKRVPEQRTAVKKVIIHANYGFDPMVGNDICVMEFDTGIYESDKVKYSTLATDQTYDGILEQGLCKEALVMGYGAQEYKGDNAATKKGYNPNAQCITLEVIDHEKCKDVSDVIDLKSMFCAYDATLVGKDGCQGDSGGPLYCGHVQMGIVSAGFGCGLPGMPSFYSRVDIFSKFIDESMRGVYNEGEMYEAGNWMAVNKYLFILAVVLVFVNK